VSGEDSSYRNWAAGEPNDYKFNGNFTAGEDYVQMNFSGARQWNDMPNSYAGTFRGIIEIPQASPTFTYNGNQYQLTSGSLSWSQAQAEAESLGGNLVTINDAAEEAWLKQTFSNTERLWIGLTDRNQEGNFQWVSGEDSSYRNWAAGEPNDYKFNGNFTAGEDYVQMNFSGARQWNDMPNSYAGTFRGIIEIGDSPSNPGVIGLETDSYQVNEADGTVDVVVTRTQGSDGVVSVDYSSANGTAIAGNDYQGQSGTLTFADGETSKIVSIPILEDNLVEGSENFSVSINNATGGATLSTVTSAQVNIQDNDSEINPGFISLATNTYQVNETDGTVDITIVRTEGSDGVVSIDYDTIEATATAGNDYTPTSGTLTFADGETSKTVTVDIVDDNLSEGNEEFGFAIDNLAGDATLLAPRTALVTIVDDETGLEPVIDFDNFADTAPLTLNGNAAQAGDVLRLTSNGGNQAGSAFLDRPLAIDSDTSFATQFQFQLSGGSGGADGFVFMLQNDAQALNALGLRGGNLGYGGAVSQSLAIEFDTYRNGWDTNNNHLSVLRDGNTSNALVTSAAPFDLNSGDLLNAWIDYDGSTNLLEVSLANTANKPGTASLSLNIDLADVVGSQAFLGFSAGTGGLSNNHDIRNWELATDSNLLAAPPTSVSLDSETLISGLNQPTAIEWTPNGDRFFIAEKGGVIKLSQNGQVNNTPFIDLTAQVNGTRDRGLLDIAVHPDFFNGSPYVYALYTYDPPEVFQNTGLAGADGNGNRAARLTRITADASTNFTTAVPGSEVVILGTNSTWDNFNAFANSTNDFDEAPAGILPDGTNLQDFLAADSESHTIGSVEFGPDGALYVSNGDGTSYNRVDPRTVRVQDIDNLSGKIIRIDPITGDGLADNPFYNGDPDANRSKVYQLGLRNPFRMTVDPRNGDVYVGDVGWTQWEEINSAGAGANFGWPYYEGGSGNNLRTGGYQNLLEAQAFYNSGQSADPSILALNHSADGINAIVLGDIYTGNAFPEEYQGDLFFSDLGQGIVYNANFDDQGNVTSFNTFTTGANVVVQIIEAPDGSLYYVDLDDGIVGRWFFS
ncbi:MAG: Calx-beta domain-containing protein, partial [Cyanobacteria bacterium J06642_3]